MNTTTTTPPENSLALNLVLGDIAAVVNIIDKVARRGAFEGQEFSEVGALRGRFITFIEAVNKLNAEKAGVQKPDSPDSGGIADVVNFPTK